MVGGGGGARGGFARQGYTYGDVGSGSEPPKGGSYEDVDGDGSKENLDARADINYSYSAISGGTTTQGGGSAGGIPGEIRIKYN